MQTSKLLTASFALVLSSVAFAAMPTGDLTNNPRTQSGTAGVITGTTSGDTTDGTNGKPADMKPKKAGKTRAKKASKKSDDSTKTGSEKSNPDPSSMDSGMNKNQ